MPRKDTTKDPINKKNREDSIHTYHPKSDVAAGLIKKYQEVDKKLNGELLKKEREQDKELVTRRREILKNLAHTLASMGIDVKDLPRGR